MHSTEVAVSGVDGNAKPKRWQLCFGMLALATVFSLVPMAGSAGASTVSLLGGVLDYNSSGNTLNDVTIAPQGGLNYRVSDPGETSVVGVGCTPVSLTSIDCPSALFSSIDVSLGDQDDSVSISGSRSAVLHGDAGDDTITGGSAADTIDGGDGIDVLSGAGGNDAINSLDGFIDQVQCGSGADSVVGDSFDILSGDCEVTDLHANGGGNGSNGSNGNDGSNGGNGNGGAVTGRSVISIPKQTARVRGRKTSVKIKCSGSGSEPCRGIVRLQTTKKMRSGARCGGGHASSLRKLDVGRESLSIPVGKTTAMKVNLGRIGRNVFSCHRRQRINVIVVSPDSTTGKSVTVKRVLRFVKKKR